MIPSNEHASMARCNHQDPPLLSQQTALKQPMPMWSCPQITPFRYVYHIYVPNVPEASKNAFDVPYTVYI